MTTLELSPTFPLEDQATEISQSPQTPPDIATLFNNVTAFVEVRAQSENRSRAIAEELRQMGARVLDRLGPQLTHVFFREGCRRTVKWSERHNVPLVSVRWILACKRARKLLPTEDYAALSGQIPNADGTSPSALNMRRRMRSMQPKSLEEDLKWSSERKRRNTRRNARRNELRRKVHEAEEMLRSFENDDVTQEGITNNYFANPQIYVAKTPPSMREFAERRGRKDSVSSESSISPIRAIPRHIKLDHEVTIKTPARPLHPSNSAVSATSSSSLRSPRRRLGLKIQEESTPDISSSSSSTTRPLFSHCRRLFDSSTFEPGVLIEPKNASNRVQDMSSVFPKAFQKRKIPGSTDSTQRKRSRSCHEAFFGHTTLPPPPSDSTSESEADTEPEVKPKPTSFRQVRAPGLGRNLELDQERESNTESESFPKEVQEPGISGEQERCLDQVQEPEVASLPSPSRTASPSEPDIGALLQECRRRSRPLRARTCTTPPQKTSRSGATLLSSIDDDVERLQLLKRPLPSRRAVRFSNPTENSTSSSSVSSSVRRRSARLLDSSVKSTYGPNRIMRRSAPVALPGQSILATVAPSEEKPASSPPSVDAAVPTWVNTESEQVEEVLEKVYGVMEHATSEAQPRRSKRRSAASVLQKLTCHSPASSTTSNSSFGIRQRPSLDDFQCSSSSQASSKRRRRPTAKLRQKRQIVMTSLHASQQKVVSGIISVLGGARVRQQVDQQTTHVVTIWPIRRTLNLLRARLLGIPVLRFDWLQESREAGQWLPEEKYWIKEFCPKELTPTSKKIFSKCSSIFVANGVSPPQRDLVDIIGLAGGEDLIAKSPKDAHIVISSAKDEQSPCVDPKWVLDSIMACEALPLENYQCSMSTK